MNIFSNKLNTEWNNYLHRFQSGSGEKIQEFIDTGKVSKLEDYRTNGV